MGIDFSTEDTIRKPVLKAIGVGGAGGNAINNMIEMGFYDMVDFVAMNTDTQALSSNAAPVKVQLGGEITSGHGAGADPKVGREAAVASEDTILNVLYGSDLVFIAAGMGGGTGTGAAPVVAQFAKEQGITVVAVVTMPFSWEGRRRNRVARQGVEELKKVVDTLVVVSNDKLAKLAGGRRLGVADGFKKGDEVLRSAIGGIVDIIHRNGLVNVDFADVKRVLMPEEADDSPMALMGTGEGVGEDAVEDALRQAMANPLLDGVTVDGAKGVLINITASHEFPMDNLERAVGAVEDQADEDANIIFGLVLDEAMGEKVQLTVIATKLAGMEGRDTAAVQAAQVGSRAARPVEATRSRTRSAPAITQEAVPKWSESPRRRTGVMGPVDLGAGLDEGFDLGDHEVSRGAVPAVPVAASEPELTVDQEEPVYAKENSNSKGKGWRERFSRNPFFWRS